jgi:hypothetical protein
VQFFNPMRQVAKVLRIQHVNVSMVNQNLLTLNSPMPNSILSNVELSYAGSSYLDSSDAQFAIAKLNNTESSAVVTYIRACLC